MLPASQRSWLYEPGSLTLRLQRQYGDAFRVMVLGQGWARGFGGERRLLGLRPGTLCLAREVALMNGDQPLVLARSIIPAQTLRRADPGLARLGSRPLGEVLFACPHLRRTHMQLARVQSSEFRAMAPEVSVWGRRSLYTIAAGDLLVCEFFLPEVVA
ncbi:MAG: chorismate lyase [Methylococcaceae bacterium]|nr:MAG: chorismate lyase [Methylococcaceae bacterium]